MAKHQKAKTAKGGRNGDRPNGKAWGKNHVATGKHPGHNETGRTKPSGHSIGGHALTKLRERSFDAHVSDVADHVISAVKASRDTQHRKTIRRSRMSDKKSVKTSK